MLRQAAATQCNLFLNVDKTMRFCVRKTCQHLGGLAMAEYVGAGACFAQSIYSALFFWYFFNKKKVHGRIASHTMVNSNLFLKNPLSDNSQEDMEQESPSH